VALEWKKAFGLVVFFSATIVLTYLLYLAFFSGPDKEKRYWYWDATVTFVWYDGAESGDEYALGKSRYKIRLPNGRHEAARSFLDESFSLYDCVRVREHLSATITPIPFEIIGATENCWQPE